jgi:hypothetical protein
MTWNDLIPIRGQGPVANLGKPPSRPGYPQGINFTAAIFNIDAVIRRVVFFALAGQEITPVLVISLITAFLFLVSVWI